MAHDFQAINNTSNVKLFEQLGAIKFTVPDQVRTDYHAWMSYTPLSDDITGVYILRGIKGEALYVGYTTQLKRRLASHMSKHYRDEIKTVDYIVCNHRNGGMNALELEKILYYLLRPKYSKKKILPDHYYTMKRRR